MDKDESWLKLEQRKKNYPEPFSHFSNYCEEREKADAMWPDNVGDGDDDGVVKAAFRTTANENFWRWEKSA